MFIALSARQWQVLALLAALALIVTVAAALALTAAGHAGPLPHLASGSRNPGVLFHE